MKPVKLILLIAGLWIAHSVQAQDNGQIVINEDIRLTLLQDSVYMHTAFYQTENYGRVGANGAILVKDGEAVLIDTPWDNEQTRQLTEFLEDSLHIKIVKFIAGHYHEDCMGGLEYLQNKGIESIANSRTVEMCKQKDLPVPAISFSDSLLVDLNGLKLECRYFGAGHTDDNITVWVPEKQFLFGGCLIKTARARTLGNVREADIDHWDETVRRVQQSYPNVSIVVPGHGAFGGAELLSHTIELIEQQ